MKRFIFGFIAASTVLLVHGKLVLFPQTYGPYKSLLARILARILVRNSSTIVARDTRSREVAASLAAPRQRIKLSPDVAFALEAARPESLVLDPPTGTPLDEGVIGINVNGLMYNGGYTRANMFGLKLDYPLFLRELVSTLAKESGGRILLVPHTYAPLQDVESDNAACIALRDALPAEVKEKVSIVAAEYDQHEIKGVIGQCGFFVGSRMHSCIAALSQGVPCVGVAYSGKFQGVFESVGAGEWVVDGREVSTTQAVERIAALFQERQKIREPLRSRATAARSDLAVVFKDLLEAKS
jgi:polysaccharide pyruvyl transferase WcaK-like protein